MSESLIEQLKAAIEQSGMTRYKLAQAAGVEESTLSRFVNGKRSLSLESASRLAEVLNLELKPRRKARKAK
jgi:transcriptional regulator with XRE-family HTH domain